MKIKSVFTFSILSLALYGCGGSDAPENQPGSVTLSGEAIAGETLTATVDDPDGFDPSGVSYQWLANGIPLSDQTGSSFTLTPEQRGATIRVSVTYVDDGGTREGATSNETPEVLANEAGTIVVSGASTVGAVLTAEVTDGNGLPETVNYSWSASGVVIEGETSQTLELGQATEGETITATATYTDLEGFEESITSEPTDPVAPEGTNTPAEFSGLSATVQNNVTEPLTGEISVTDVDENESSIVAQTDTTITYGTFSISESGEWSYNLNTDDPVVAGLANASESVEDNAVIESADGTVATLVITIIGVNPASGNNQAAVIRDLTDDDTGELRFTLPEAQAAGRIEVSFTRTDDDLGNGDAFISLFNSENNNAGSIIDLRIRDDQFATRYPERSFEGVEVTPGTLQDIVITWAYPVGNTAAGQLPVVTVEIDGEMAVDPFTPDGSNPEGGVATVSFRFGNNSLVLPEAAQYTINEFALYSDVDGDTLVFEDDYSTYSEGFNLDSEVNSTSPYAPNTEDAVVEEYGAGSADGNQFARVIDTDDSDTGELRFSLPEAQAEGRFDLRFTRTDDDAGSTDAFISLFNSGNNNAGSIMDLRVRDDSFGLRYPDVDIEGAVVTPGEFQTLSVTWSYPDGNTAAGQLPTITLEIDGEPVIEPFEPTGSNPEGGVTTISLRFGSNSTALTQDAMFWLDDLIIYADTAGTNVVFQDDFQSYAEGEDLDPDNNVNSVYASNTSEAVVAAEQ
ncbi:VCBS domain-containing protein [Alteromonas halophila]|nr:VCBS domain-containing protein [Alteromonas halophila]